eukprot:8898_1
MSLKMQPLLSDQDTQQPLDTEMPPYENEKSVMESVRLSRTLSMQMNEETEIIASKSSIVGCVFNYTNSIIGAGIIGLPYALHIAGFYYGIILLILVSLLIDYGVRHLVECGVSKNKLDYELIVEYQFGKRGYYTVTLFMFLFAYGAMVAYHIVIGDTITPIVHYANTNGDYHKIYNQRWFIITIFSIIFMLPLSLLKNMASLDKTSALSFVCVIVIVFTVTIQGAKVSPYNDLNQLNVEHLLINQQWFAGAGTMAFAFVCHHNTFVVFNSLKNNTARRWGITTHLSLAISVFFSMWLAIAGFVNFQTETKGDILNNFRYDNPAINFARGLLALTMVFTYPMELFVARYSILQSLKLRNVINAGNENKWFYFITILLWFSTLIIGAFIYDISVVLELVGVVCGATVGFILPGLVSLRVFGWHNLKNKMIQAYRGTDSRGKRYSCKDKYIAGWNFLFPIFMMIFGLVIMIMGLTEIFLNI